MMIHEIPNTPFNARLARGHEMRKGHKLNAREVSVDGILFHRVYLCCGEAIPETVKSWEETVPAKPVLIESDWDIQDREELEQLEEDREAERLEQLYWKAEQLKEEQDREEKD